MNFRAITTFGEMGEQLGRALRGLYINAFLQGLNKTGQNLFVCLSLGLSPEIFY